MDFFLRNFFRRNLPTNCYTLLPIMTSALLFMLLHFRYVYFKNSHQLGVYNVCMNIFFHGLIKFSIN